MGIFLFMLETCLRYENYKFDRVLFEDAADDSVEKTLIAKYVYFDNMKEQINRSKRKVAIKYFTGDNK